MKNLVLLSVLISSFSFGQTNTSTQDGGFYNPLNWDCFCIPANGDTLIINHDLTLGAPLYYTSGQITVNGSLTEDGTDRDIWINGGSMINNGTVEAYRLYISLGFIENSGTIGPLDSLWTKTPFTNSGTVTTYDFLNDETADFDNSGLLTITNNFNNQGLFLNDGGTITVANDFSNCNTQTLNAIFTNNGMMCIDADFSNCADDTLTGNGDYHIGGSSANLGVFDGTHTFNTPSGTVGIPGNIQAGVTIGSAPCGLGVADQVEIEINIYPNPTASILNISIEGFEYAIYDYTGSMVAYGWSDEPRIDVNHLDYGVYWLRILSEEGEMEAIKFIKQ